MADKVVKTSELRAKGDSELTELVTATKNTLFKAKFENHTNRLNDTATIGKARRELARLYTLQGERARSAKAAAAPAAKAAKATKAAAPAKKTAAKKGGEG